MLITRSTVVAMLDQIRSKASREYLAYCAEHSEEQLVGDYILLYGQSYIAERNETYELPTYLPGWFTLGDDGGGTAILMRLDGSPTVFRCDHGAIGSIEPEIVAETFSSWFADGCPASWMDEEGDGED